MGLQKKVWESGIAIASTAMKSGGSPAWAALAKVLELSFGFAEALHGSEAYKKVLEELGETSKQAKDLEDSYKAFVEGYEEYRKENGRKFNSLEDRVSFLERRSKMVSGIAFYLDKPLYFSDEALFEELREMLEDSDVPVGSEEGDGIRAYPGGYGKNEDPCLVSMYDFEPITGYEAYKAVIDLKDILSKVGDGFAVKGVRIEWTEEQDGIGEGVEEV